MNDNKRKPLGKAQKFENNAAKWINGIGEQLYNQNESINVKCIPISQIIFDPENSRQLILKKEEMINGPKITINEFDEQHQGNFLIEVENYFSTDKNAEQKISEYLDLAYLASSIKTFKDLINPITVYAKDNEFYLISGHRRTLAHLILGEDKIFAKILSKTPDILEHNLIQWKENKDRQDLSLFDEICNIDKVIKSWETLNNKKISIRILMSLLNIKKTKASNYLAIIRESIHNKKLLLAIKSQKLNSLEVAYNISTIECNKDKEVILDEILANDKYTYDQLMLRIKQKNKGVRTPDTFKNKKETFIKITKKSNLDIISKITHIIIKTPEMKFLQNELEQINLKTKDGLTLAWEKIYEALEN